MDDLRARLRQNTQKLIAFQTFHDALVTFATSGATSPRSKESKTFKKACKAALRAGITEQEQREAADRVWAELG